MSTLEVILRAAGLLAAFLLLPLLVGQTEHKVMAHMQGRLGPMYAGGFHGWAQLVADGAKFVQKEDIVPAAADKRLFRLAPALALIPYLVALAAIPVHPGFAVADLPGGALFVLAATSVGILGTLVAGWASANKYALIGAMRSAAQLIAYELPLALAVASVTLAAGTLSLGGIIDAWEPWWLLWQLPGALVFLVAAVAELQRPPFARRVWRDRRDVVAVLDALPRRLAGPVRRPRGLGVDAAQRLRHRAVADLDPGVVATAARGPAAALRLADPDPVGPAPTCHHRSRRRADGWGVVKAAPGRGARADATNGLGWSP